MIQAVGTKRILVLAILVAANAALAGSVYVFLQPHRFGKERQLKTLQGQVSTIQSDIGRMQIEFDQLESQQVRFDQLKAQGFFFNQGRRAAEQIFEKMSTQAGVIAAVAGIQSGAIEENEEAAKSDHVVLVSPVNITVDAFDSVDVFRYLYLLERYLPGHVSVEHFELTRQQEVTGAVLRQIASGGNPSLVKAEIQITWRTMIPKSQVIGAQQAQGAP